MLSYTPRMMRRTPPRSTKLEIEIKLRLSDVQKTIQTLRHLHARQRHRVLEKNTVYDTPAADFRHSGRLVRLRTERSAAGHLRSILTAKAPPPHGRSTRPPRYKERLERETPVSHPSRTERLLRSIGLRASFRYEKYRTPFELPGLHIALDETPVGLFLELEGRPAAIDRVARALGFRPDDYFRGTYWDLYAADCRRKGRQPRNMLFPHKKSAKPSLFP